MASEAESAKPRRYRVQRILAAGELSMSCFWPDMQPQRLSAGSGRRRRSETTSPLRMRKPFCRAVSKRIATADAKCEPKTSAVVVPCEREGPHELAGHRLGMTGAANLALGNA